MKRQAWQDLRLRFVISHSLVAGQLYSIFPAIKHRDGHPGTTFSPLIQGQALVPRYSHHHQSVYAVCLLSHLHTYILWDHSWLMMALREPELLSRTHFRKKKKKQYCTKYWEKPVQPRGWLPWYYVPSRHAIIPCAASLTTWPVPWSPGLRMGAVQTWAAFPLLPVLLHVCGMDVTCPFLPCLGDQGAHRWCFLLCFLLPAGILDRERWIRCPVKWTQALYANPSSSTLSVLVRLPLIRLHGASAFLSSFPFIYYGLTTPPLRQNRERSIPNLFQVTLYFIISQECNWNMDAGVWYEDLSEVMLDHSVMQQLFNPRRQQTEMAVSILPFTLEVMFLKRAVQCSLWSRTGNLSLTVMHWQWQYI